MLMQVQRRVRTIIFCDTYLTQYNLSNWAMSFIMRDQRNVTTFSLVMLSACSLSQVVCGVNRVFTEQLFGVFNSSNTALTSAPGSYLRMICFRGKRQSLNGCIQWKYTWSKCVFVTRQRPSTAHQELSLWWIKNC